MNIYFSGSIRGGREDQDLYLKIIDILRPFGSVLTEHMGDKTLSSYGDTHMTDSEIYERDMSWLKRSHVVIADVTCPSLGVGYEVAWGESLGKPVLCLYRPSVTPRPSAMIAGDARLTLRSYEQVEELPALCETFFAAVAAAV